MTKPMLAVAADFSKIKYPVFLGMRGRDDL